MKRKTFVALRGLISTTIWTIALTHFANADEVVFNTFGPNMTYLTANDGRHSLDIGCLLSAPAACDLTAQEIGAIAFTPSQSFTLTAITLPAFHFGGGNDLLVYLASGSSSPGVPIERFTVSNLPNAPEILTFTSVIHPSLQGGSKYWIVVSTSNNAKNAMEWSFAEGVGLTCGQQTGTPWSCGQSTVNGQPVVAAVQVRGTSSATSMAVADLARSVVGGNYLWGGKGWDWNESIFVNTSESLTGYHYYDIDSQTISFGDALDCSGLVFWSYNKAHGSTRYQDSTNPIYYEGADAQYWYNSVNVAPSDLMPGDLLFFDWNGDGRMEHVAMYVGGDDVIQASSPTVGIIRSSKTALLQKYAGSVFTRRPSAPIVGAQVVTHSPVTLSVTDPDGLTINALTRIVTPSEILREVPKSLYYSEYALESNGSLEDMVTAPVLKPGAYLIKPIPIQGVSSSATYSIDFVAGGVTIELAKNAPISGIPVEGFGIAVMASSIAEFIPVTIEIEPGRVRRAIDLDSERKVRLAILSSADFDATKINPSSLNVAGASVAFRENGRPEASFEDVNRDGRLDLVIRIPIEELQLNRLSTQVALTGYTLSGKMIRGTIAVKMECPTTFGRFETRETEMSGASKSKGQEDDAGRECRIVAADRGGYHEQ